MGEFLFLSTLSLRRATQNPTSITPAASRNFYPRSPCGERRYWSCVPVVGRAISIHALLAESDQLYIDRTAKAVVFLSTLSLRRATCRAKISESRYRHFYPRSPCGERHPSRTRKFTNIMISIHALLAESDRQPGYLALIHSFLSTLSLRRATTPEEAKRWNSTISIHALLAESDRINRDIANSERKFLSTLSLRRATCWFA